MAVGELAVNVVARTRKAISNLGKFRNEAKSVKKPVDSMGVSVKGFERKVREWPVPVNAASTSVDNLGKRSKKTGRELSHLSKKSNLLSRSMRRIGVAAAGIFAANVTVRNFRSFADDLDRTAKVGAKLNVVTENLIGLRHAANQTGVGNDKLDMSLQRMTRRVAEAAQGLGEAQGALKELRLDAKKLNTLAPDQQFARIADAMKKVKSPTDQVRLAFKLFDSEGVDLVNTLKLGSAGLREMKKDADRLGITFTSGKLKRVEDFNDQLDRLSKSLGGLGQQIVIEVAPLAADVINLLNDAVVFIKTRSKQGPKRNPWYDLPASERRRRHGENMRRAFNESRRGPIANGMIRGMGQAREQIGNVGSAVGGYIGDLGARLNGLQGSYTKQQRKALVNGVIGRDLFGNSIKPRVATSEVSRPAANDPAASKMIGSASRMFGNFLGRTKGSDLVASARGAMNNLPSFDQVSGLLGGALNAIPQATGPMGHQGINRAVDANTIEGYMALRANTRGGGSKRAEEAQKATIDAKAILEKIHAALTGTPNQGGLDLPVS